MTLEKHEPRPLTVDAATAPWCTADAVPLRSPQPDAEQEPTAAIDRCGENVDELTVRIELGRTYLSDHDVARLQSGSLVQLDSLTDDPIEIQAGGRLIATGELIVVDGKLAARVVQRISAENQGQKAA